MKWKIDLNVMEMEFKQARRQRGDGTYNVYNDMISKKRIINSHLAVLSLHVLQQETRDFHVSFSIQYV